MALKLKTAPTSEPVTTPEAKSHMYVTASDDDTYIGTLITAARQHLEDVLNKSFITQTWYLFLDEFPDGDEILLNRPPVASVTSVTYYDGDGALQTFSSANYRLDDSAEPGRLVLTDTASWPDTQTSRPKAVIVEFVTGYGAAATVPEYFKLAIKMLVAHAYEHREATVTGTIMKEIELGLNYFANAHRVHNFA